MICIYFYIYQNHSASYADGENISNTVLFMFQAKVMFFFPQYSYFFVNGTKYKYYIEKSLFNA